MNEYHIYLRPDGDKYIYADDVQLKDGKFVFIRSNYEGMSKVIYSIDVHRVNTMILNEECE